jgi:SAM-dependent methyltransferase
LTCSFCGSSDLQKLEPLPILRCRCGVAYNAKDFFSDPRLATRSYFELLEGARKQSERIFLAWAEKIAEFLPTRPGQVLDVGFGYGIFLEKMAARGYAPWGVEITEASCQSLRQRLPGSRIFSGSLTDPAIYEMLKDQRFDLISFWDCLQYIPDAAQQLRLADSLLAKDGLLVVQVPSRSISNLKYAQTVAKFHYDLGRFWLHLPAAKMLFDPVTFKNWLLCLGGGYQILAESSPVNSLNFSIRLGSFAEAVEDTLSLGWAFIAKRRGEPISNVFVLRKQ